MATSSSSAVNLDGLRQRNTPQQAPSAEDAKEAVQGLNAEEMVDKASDKAGEVPRTFGRTPGGISGLRMSVQKVHG